ncbi:MAG: hypothetical protein K2X29_10515 [Candidatus Obscuribacterales bacterium]|nr:hypothetical protein [Candidatus Obscuribacterales bacterium]
MRRNPKELSKMKKRFKFYTELQERLFASGVKLADKVRSAYRFRKRHPQDCGRARCGLCSRHKRFGELSVKDLIADDRERDQRDEALDPRE